MQHRPEIFRWNRNPDGSVTVVLGHQASSRGRWEDCRHRHRYTLHPAGQLVVENDIVVGPDLVDLPRVGVRLDFPSTYEQVRYFGRGPWDNYSDRKASTLVGLHQTTVTHFYVSYVMPQEHGHRTEVRWLELAQRPHPRTGPTIRLTGSP